MRALSSTWSLTVTWQRWRSHYTICGSRKSYAARGRHGSVFYRAGLIAEFRSFCSHDLDFDPMTFIHELDPYPSSVPAVQKWTLYDKTFESNRITIYTQTYIETPPKTLPHGFADGKINSRRIVLWYDLSIGCGIGDVGFITVELLLTDDVSK